MPSKKKTRDPAQLSLFEATEDGHVDLSTTAQELID
jgi:hypothetical protein